MTAPPTLNERALQLAEDMIADASSLRLAVETTPSGARVLDCGVRTEGSLQAGLGMARVCLAGLAEVSLAVGDVAGIATPQVQVLSDNPVLACMASQYAGWQIKVGKFSAMGSGPMRAAYGKEELFRDLPGRESPSVAVGVLESGKLPQDDVAAFLGERLGLPPSRITLLAAPITSLCGTLQVVARSLETALHKLRELKFDLRKVVAGMGTAPLPPVARDWLQAMGRANDAVLYGGRVVLWVRADEVELLELGPRVPSCGSGDFGAPFADIFHRYQGDFYKMDPLLFSPAEVVLHNLQTGRAHHFGKAVPDVLLRSFDAGE